MTGLSRRGSILIGIIAAAALAAFAEQVMAPCVADAHVYATPWDPPDQPDKREDIFNFGASNWLTLKGREYFGLLQFDLSAARGLSIQKATLRFYREATFGPGVPLSTMGISTISGSGPWSEGNQTGAPAKPGEVNYLWARAGQQPWSYPGSDLADVVFGPGGSLYTYGKPRDVGGGWFEFDLPPAMAAALATGDQYGLLLSDEKGQAYGRHYIGSRISRFPPVLILDGNRDDSIPPGPVLSLKAPAPVIVSTSNEAEALGRKALAPGTAILRFGHAGDDTGQGIASRYELRYSPNPITETNWADATAVPRWSLNALASKTDPLAASNSLSNDVTAFVEDLTPGARYYFAARATDEAGNTGPVSPLGLYEAYSRVSPKLPVREEWQPGSNARIPRKPKGPMRSDRDGPRIWAVPDLLKVDPQTGELLERGEFRDHRTWNSVWDASSATIHLTGARNEFVAFQLAIESPEPVSGLEILMADPLFRTSKLPLSFESSGAVQFYREYFIPDDKPAAGGGPWYADALIPLSAPFEVPARDNAVPGQTVQPVFVDVYIPHDAAPGVHAGTLSVRSASGWLRDLRVEVQVLPFALPDKLNFTVDLNCYGGVNAGYAITRGTPEYRRLVHAYHRLAHLHRANLNVLGYSHTGGSEPDYAPPLEGEGATTRVANWSDWDSHFGPLLDGSAFADLPRASVPITDMYLNFFENWPGDIHTNYAFDNYPRATTAAEYKALIAKHALEASPIEEAFSQQYQDRFSAVARDFAAHLKSRGWLSTQYQVYFNNKYFYKDPSTSTGRGTSWWLLDEPNHRDDYRALSFFGNLAKRWLEDYPDVPVIFRTDISYVDFIRDILAGQIDLNCTSSRFFSKNRLLRDDTVRFGRVFWNYASTNHPRESNTAMRAWCWKVWLAGGDGIVPWNTVKGSESWDRAEPLTVFYPGSKFGRNEPFASMRLKAYRRGQQDVEYFTLLASLGEWNRQDVVAAIADAGGTAQSNTHYDDIRLRVAEAIIRLSGK